LSCREQGTRDPDLPAALPVYSTDTPEEAELLISTVARLMFDGRLVYSFPDFQPERDGSVAAIDAAADTFAELAAGRRPSCLT
jgi:hypothetical protein